MENSSILSKLIKERKEKESKRPKELSPEKKKENIKKWTTFYRRNWNLYAAHRLKIKLHPFQHIMLYLIGVSQVFFAICSRGLSKSFIVALAAIIKACLYPYSEIVITATTIKQAEKMVRNKMERELCKKLSPVLKYFYDTGQIKFSYNKEEVRVDFLFNDSWIIVAPAVDSARGERATLLIYEECRLLKKGIIDSVFEKMAHPRQAMFMNDPKYSGDERWMEECQSVYITSARFKSEWFWRTFKTVVQECFTNKKIPYNFFAGDIFLSMKFGLKTKSDYFKAKKQSGEADFRMEDLNEMIGEAEDAFFSRESFKNNQVIPTAFTPPKISNLSGNNKIKNREKLSNEKRLLFIDYAFANTTSKEANDNTIIGCMYGQYEDNKIQRGVEYITTHSASDSIGCERKIRELFWDYQCDYIVLDLRNGGEVNYNHLTQEWIHPERSKEDWIGKGQHHGFTVVRDSSLHVVPQNKIDDLVSRTIDKQAIPCIIPIVGTSELNSLIWLDMQKKLNDNQIDFLIEDIEFEQKFEETKGYFSMTVEEKTEIRLPYVQTMLLINEAVNLSQEWRDGKVKLIEPRSGTKDRIVSCSYGNYVMSLIENKMSKDGNNEEYDDSAWDFLSGDYSGVEDYII